MIDPSTFFPIGVFYQPTWAFDTWKARGVNTLYGYEPYNATNAAWSFVARADGFHYIREADNAAVDATDPYLLAYVNPIDEPDVRGPDAYAATIATYQQLKSINPKIPVMNTFSGGYVTGWQTDGPTPAQYKAMYAASDWIATCMYPVTGWDQPNATTQVGISVDDSRAIDPSKRQFAYIETGNQHLPWLASDERSVTPDEFRGEIWDAIIHGATGIIYFPDALSPFSYDTTDPLVEPEMKIQNAKLTQYGGAILSGKTPPASA